MLNLLIQAEFTRFRANHSNKLWCIVVGLVLLASSWSAGNAAADYRATIRQQIASWKGKVALYRSEASGRMDPADPRELARSAFDFSRDSPAPAMLQGGGGLALGVRHLAAIESNLKVSVESRYGDGRRSDPLTNPALGDAGVPDFAVVVALLVPLLILGLSGAVRQETEEHGTWQLLRVQAASPRLCIAVALGVRLVVVVSIVSLASLPAFLLDPGATVSAGFAWLGAVALLCTGWMALCAAANFSRLSSSAAMLVLLASWLLSSFGVPAAISLYAREAALSPSRLEAILLTRAAGEEVDRQLPELVSRWYREHPAQLHPEIKRHEWPVTYVPRGLELDRKVRPLMMEFERDRVRRSKIAGTLTWLSPSLGLILVADRLAGTDAQSRLDFVERVNRFEDRWRSFFVPRIMSYRGLSEADHALVPRFESSTRD